MGNGIHNGIRDEKGLTSESRKSLSAQVGVKGFEPSTSWSRTKAAAFRKSGEGTSVTSQVDCLAVPETLFDYATTTADLRREGANGLRNGIPDTTYSWRERDNKPADFTRECGICGTTFTPTARAVSRGYGFYCSPSCAASVPRPNAPHVCPESTRADRIRANGLVNKRKKLGWFKPPAACMKCGAAKRLDSHHPDYGKPDEVLWLCRGCHRLAHTQPASIADLSPVKLDKAADAPARAAGGKGKA